MSFLKRFFQTKEEPTEEPFDFSSVLVDMHSHLIPGIDDGAETMEDSIRLITNLRDLGFKKLITTPHIFWDLYRNTPETILPGLDLVRKELVIRNIDVELHAAAEYYLDENFENLIEQKKLLTFGGNYILFELSFASEPPNLQRALFNMSLQGYRPILAHPERYEYWNPNFQKYIDLHEKDVLLQLNLNCLTGHYGPTIKKVSEKMIDAGIVSFIGTDCHHDGHVELLRSLQTNKKLRQLLESGTLKNIQL
jgi:protein-tyrosine phosphatase